MNFKAAVFDFDGTITEKGVYSPSPEMISALVDLSRKMPIAFCTGRQFESFEKRCLDLVLAAIPDSEHEGFLKNLYLMAENGAIGYFYNGQEFEEFYRVAWPEKFVAKAEMKERLRVAVEGYGDVYDDAHKVVIVMRTRLHDHDNRDINEVYRLSGEIYKIVTGLLSSIDPEYERFLHVGDSGLGVIVGPADGDKDIAVKYLADFLSRQRGISFGENAREILAVGDSPGFGGNDYYFLSGRFGTPYSVSDVIHEDRLLNYVFGEDGVRMVHGGGTLFLIKTLLKE